MKSFGGPVLFLDRADINTDEIIPARYLTEVTKEALTDHLLEDLELNGFDPARDIPGKAAIVTRDNFGCGSSREHAPWALEMNGINVVVAQGFARIFRQNMFNCGMLAVELPVDRIERLFERFAPSAASAPSGEPVLLSVDLPAGRLAFVAGGLREEFDFEVSPFDLELVRAGGWVEYADSRY